MAIEVELPTCPHGDFHLVDSSKMDDLLSVFSVVLILARPTNRDPNALATPQFGGVPRNHCTVPLELHELHQVT